MNKKYYLFSMPLALSSLLLLAPLSAHADIEWTMGKQRHIENNPLDIASSLDGQWIYILSSGEITIYSILDEKVINRIPVDKSFDRLSYSEQANTLFVSSGIRKTIKPIQLELVQKLSLEGLAIKGSDSAPVTIAVFGDYQ